MSRSLSFVLLLSLALSADTVRLIDGRVLQGTIDQEDSARIHLKMEHGALWIQRDQVAAIDRTSAPPREDPDHSAKETAAAMAARGLVQREGAWVTPARAKLLDLLDKLRIEDAAASWQALSLDDASRAEVKALLDEARASLSDATGDAVKKRVIEEARKGVMRLRLQVLILVQDDTKYDAEHGDPEARREVDAGVAQLTMLAGDPYRWWFEQDGARVALRRRYGEALSLAEKSKALATDEVSSAHAFLDALRANVSASEVLDDATLDRFRRYRDTEVRPANEKMQGDLDDSSREVARLVNEYRRWMGLRPLRLDKRLIACARAHSKEMEDLHYFSHTSPTAANRNPSDRARSEGFESNLVGENIAQGDNTPAEVFEAWQRSPGHHKSLLDARFVTFGAARMGESWTLVFGGEANR